MSSARSSSGGARNGSRRKKKPRASTRSRRSALVGAQRPRHANLPRYVSSSGREATELAAAAGLHLDPWQAWALEQSLGERAGGKWSSFEVGILAPRQNGKGSIIEARCIAGLYLFGERLISYSAHEFKTAQETFIRVLELVTNTDDLRRMVKTIRTAHGDEGIELLTGQRLRFIARTKQSGRGFTGDTVILDEAFALTARQLGTLMPTLSARPNPQLWYASSAGDEEAIELAKIRRRGLDGSPRLCFLEWSAPDDADLDDRHAWAQANPGLGIRISEEVVEAEREALSDDDFARERLGIWRRSSRRQVIPRDTWLGVQDTRSSPAAPIRFGIDVSTDRTMGAIVAGGGGVVELIDHHSGTGWMVDRAVHLGKQWNGVFAVDAGGPAASIADDIELEGVTVERLNGPELARACARFYDGVMEGTIKIRPHVVLTAAVAGAAKRMINDRFVWSRTASTSDVTPLIAASLAVSVPKSEPEGEDFAFVV